MKKFSRIASRTIALTLLCNVALQGCDWLRKDEEAPLPAKPKKKVQKTYNATEFLSELTESEIILENGGSLADIEEQLGVIESYSSAKKIKPVTMTLASVDYTAKNMSGTQTALIPAYGKNLPASFNEIGRLLNNPSYTIKEVNVVRGTIKPTPLNFDKATREAVLQEIQGQNAAIKSRATSVPTIEQAKTQLRLAHGFADLKQKDGAYLCADNAKRLLAQASRENVSPEVIALHSKELEAIEARVQKELPY